jgi:hypothetical protein
MNMVPSTTRFATSLADNALTILSNTSPGIIFYKKFLF